MFVAWLVGGSLVASANQTVGPPPDDMDAEEVSITSQSGTEIAAWLFPVRNPRATVILVHSIRGDRRTMLPRARLLRARNFATLLIDLQAHGESAGEHITMGYLERHDVLAAVEFVKLRAPDQPVALIGKSLGGASALLAAPEVDAMVVESVYPTIQDAVHDRVGAQLGPLHYLVAPLLLCQLKPRLGVAPTQLRPIDMVSQIHCPVLIATGDADLHTPLKETRRIFEAANEPKRMVVFKDAAHVDLFDHDRHKYEVEVIGFLEQLFPTSQSNVPLN